MYLASPVQKSDLDLSDRLNSSRLATQYFRVAEQPLATNSPFPQGIGGERVCRDSFHDGHCEFEQFTGAKDVSHRASYSRTVVVRFREQTVDNPGEKAIGPVRVSAIAGGIKFLHRAPHPAAILHYGDLIPRDSLAWNLGDMFNVVKEGHSIVIGAQ